MALDTKGMLRDRADVVVVGHVYPRTRRWRWVRRVRCLTCMHGMHAGSHTVDLREPNANHKGGGRLRLPLSISMLLSRGRLTQLIGIGDKRRMYHVRLPC